jgi:alkyldihydroxyacetonephosphate synthase
MLKDTLVRSGASLSHHHGIGKRGQVKYAQYLSPTTKNILEAVKKEIDPKNVFGVGNLVFHDKVEKLPSKL